jgi:D-alanyl-D-alanine carboxypeptidase/D-alanyl-D-alanine-endopeptidase (penicillin-binding protein 4)
VFALCILHLAFLGACSRTPPRTTPVGPPTSIAPSDAPPAIPAPASAPATTAAVTSTDPASAVSRLRSAILAATTASGVQRGTWGIVVQSLDHNERLVEVNPRALLVPASIVKLLAVSTAVDAVGWDYRFATTHSTSGTSADGVLHGDLIVTGSGDPSLGGRAGDSMNVLVDAVRTAGIRRIDGRIIGNDDALEDARPALAWAWDDLGYPTGAIFGALNYAENRAAVTVKFGWSVGAPGEVTLEPIPDGRPIINRTVTVASGATQFVWPEQRPGETGLTIAGTVALGRTAARLNVSAGNPTAWFATMLRQQLIAAGIAVGGAAVDIDDIQHDFVESPLYTYRSPTLAQITVPMLKDSINLYAEGAMRLNSAAVTPKTNDTALEGFKARMTAWGISPDAYQVIDGSGLSRRDAVAPEVFLSVLQRMYDASGRSPWMQALPIAGVDGSLENRMKGTAAERNVRAKTGTMSNIRSLAGYVTSGDGEHLGFVVMLNDFEGPGAEALQAIDRIAVLLATFKR